MLLSQFTSIQTMNLFMVFLVIVILKLLCFHLHGRIKSDLPTIITVMQCSVFFFIYLPLPISFIPFMLPRFCLASFHFNFKKIPLAILVRQIYNDELFQLLSVLGKSLLFLHFWGIVLLGIVFLVGIFSFSTVNISFHSPFPACFF